MNPFWINFYPQTTDFSMKVINLLEYLSLASSELLLFAAFGENLKFQVGKKCFKIKTKFHLYNFPEYSCCRCLHAITMVCIWITFSSIITNHNGKFIEAASNHSWQILCSRLWTIYFCDASVIFVLHIIEKYWREVNLFNNFFMIKMHLISKIMYFKSFSHLSKL